MLSDTFPEEGMASVEGIAIRTKKRCCPLVSHSDLSVDLISFHFSYGLRVVG